MSGTDVKDDVKKNGADKVAEISNAAAAARKREIFGPSEGREFRNSPLQFLKAMTNFSMFNSVVKGFMNLDLSIEKGHLPAMKVIFDLAVHLEKFGSIEPQEMQSFADLLIKSLAADAAVESKSEEVAPAQLESAGSVVTEPMIEAEK